MRESFRDRLFCLISELVLCHSPSGAEQEIDARLLSRLESIGVEAGQDDAGNIIARVQGASSARAVAITAHKDEIGGIVKRVREDGKVEVRKLGGSFPWVYGEGVVDLLGDRVTVPAILSFGSRHVCHESPQKVYEEDKPPKWDTVWLDAKLSKQQLTEAGVRPGTRMVIGRHRKAPFRIGDYIASYALDNKAAVAILLLLAETLKTPASDVDLVFSAKEEVGAIGALYYTQRRRLDELIAIEIAPKSTEYPIESDEEPVLLSQDGYGMYDEALNRRLEDAARKSGVAVQYAVLSQFGSDASVTMKSGHVPRAACLGFPADNTHGYEVAHLGALEACYQLLQTYLS
ncbi:M42 family metallopeptidase [Methylocaldum sp.]|uniref:M42 family metallopeptidase n=1 Tax=Methylocaldum sp. TaxID=1969727 RepID=UPI002D67F9C3|nr:M20/M25/M40 family metallo-hydrolase [Methylocaldum sp.]HYE35586.1 M20/M25/M40 family metallo-hydrolase [Methylocaldum sp.]